MIKRFLPLLLVFFLVGCHQTTAVILPPDTTAADSGYLQTVPTSERASTAATDADTSGDQTEAAQSTSVATTPPSHSTETSKNEKPKETKPPKQNAPSQGEPDTEVTDATETTSAAAGTAPSSPPQTVPEETVPEPTHSLHPVYNISGHSVGSTEKAILAEINHYRKEAELPELKLDKKLCALATIRAYECSMELGSTRPDGRSWKSVLSDYSYGRRGTNAELRLHVKGSYNAELLVITWMNTQSQEEKILDADFTHLGIGIFKNDGKNYIVALFAG